LNELFTAFHPYHLIPKHLQGIYSYSGESHARLVLVETVKNCGEGLRILSPFYIYERRLGPYSRQMQRLYDPVWDVEKDR